VTRLTQGIPQTAQQYRRMTEIHFLCINSGGAWVFDGFPNFIYCEYADVMSQLQIHTHNKAAGTLPLPGCPHVVGLSLYSCAPTTVRRASCGRAPWGNFTITSFSHRGSPRGGGGGTGDHLGAGWTADSGNRAEAPYMVFGTVPLLVRLSQPYLLGTDH
jgi:hypothetical protein